jgi:peptide/nickel transport system substrate-binding protein
MRTRTICLLIAVFLLPPLLACRPAPRRAALIVGVEQEPASLDPRIGSDVAAERVFQMLYRGLFRPGADFRPEPDLVESWSQPDPTHYDFKLKQGIFFSDGHELTAKDVRFTLLSCLDPELPSFRKGDLARIQRIDLPGPYELRVTLREPFAAFLSGLNMGILREGFSPSSRPVGCGPYRLSKWVPGQWLVFERNPWAAPQPLSPTVAFKVIPDPVVRALELRRGSVDLVVNDLPPDSIDYFKRHGFQVIDRPGSSYAYIGLNCARPPLDRAQVRRALALAVDREALIRYVMRGFARPATGLLCPDNWAYFGKVASYRHDPARARAILDDAGFHPGPDGIRFHLTYKTSQNKVSQQIASAVAQDLATIGVDLSLQSLEWGTFYGDVKRGDFDCFGLTWVGVTDPDGFRLRFSTAAFPPEGFNRGRYGNEEVDRLLEEGAQLADQQARVRIYADVQTLLAQDVPCISLWHPDAVCVAQGNVRGIRLPTDGNFSFLTAVTRGEERRRAPEPRPPG